MVECDLKERDIKKIQPSPIVMGHRVSKRDTLQSNILSGYWSFGESLGEVLGEPELLVVGVRCHLQGEEGSVSALMDVKNVELRGRT